MSHKPAYPLLQRGHPLARGLVGAWIMHEGAGSVVGDAVGNSHGVMSSATWGSSPYGRTLDFAGTNAVVSVANQPLIKDLALTTGYSSGRVSCAVLYRPRSMGGGNQGRLVEKPGNNTQEGWSWLNIGTTVGSNYSQLWGRSAGVQNVANGIIVPSVWQAITVTYDGSNNGTNIRFYRNGIYWTNNTPGSSSTITTDNSGSLTIGNIRSLSRQLDAEIAYAFLWARELTPAEVEWHTALPYDMFAYEEPGTLAALYQRAVPAASHLLLAGSAGGIGAGVASLLATRRLSAAAAGRSTAAGAAEVRRVPRETTSGSAAATAVVRQQRPLTGTAAGTGVSGAELAQSRLLAGAPNGRGAATSAVRIERSLIGAGAAAGAAAGAVRVERTFAGAVPGYGGAAGVAQISRYFAGTTAGRGAADAVLAIIRGRICYGGMVVLAVRWGGAVSEGVVYGGSLSTPSHGGTVALREGLGGCVGLTVIYGGVLEVCCESD